MCDRNVKSEYILIKLCALVFEYICERTTKFHEKILFDSGLINIQIPMTKYIGFQYIISIIIIETFVTRLLQLKNEHKRYICYIKIDKNR